MSDSAQKDWIKETADQVIKAADSKQRNVITCASGISPSGPIHLGNLREIMVPHLIAEEIKRQGLACRHILSWDDFDRLRKVPSGAPETLASYIGRPLTDVPDPCGEHNNWAEHFKAPFRDALGHMGIQVDEISQTDMYTSGAYAQQIAAAIAARVEIQEILAQHQTKASDSPDEPAANEYFPYRPYCVSCGRDTTSIVSYDAVLTLAYYKCSCGHSGTVDISGPSLGKLVWKVDWPMRWAYESVDFEAAGADHSSPGSSFTVGKEIVRSIFSGESPSYLAYSFVGTSGSAKMSGSTGGAPTPADALEILEPQILRWLYARRRPNQSITVAFDQEVLRLYDEWDSLTNRVGNGSAGPTEHLAWERSARPTTGHLTEAQAKLPFRTLSSVADVTAGDKAQLSRILSDVSPVPLHDSATAEPRLTKAQNWITKYVPADERTVVRTQPDSVLLSELSDQDRDALKHLVDGLDEHWSIDGLTKLVYGIPKLQLGLPMDTKPTDELKAAQRKFFMLIYRLLVDADTGPRLPTLLMAVGKPRLRELLSGETPAHIN